MSFFIRKRGRQQTSSSSVSVPRKLTDRVQQNKKYSRGRGSGGTRGAKRSRLNDDDHRRPPPRRDEEITSEEDDEEEDQVPHNDDEGEDEEETQETEQEARIRLAKETLNQLKAKIKDNNEDEDEQLEELLRNQQLVERGVMLQNLCSQEFAEKQLMFKSVLKGGKVLKSPLTSVVVSPQSTAVYISTKQGGILRWDPKTGHKHHVKLPAQVLSLTVNSTTVAASTPNSIHLLDPNTLQITHTFTSSRNATHLSCTSDTLYSTHKDRTVKVWNLQEKAYVESLFGHQDTPTSVDVVPSSQRIVTSGGFDRTIRMWKIEEESQLVYNWDNDIIEVIKVLSGGFFVAGACNGDIGLFSFGRKKPLSVIHQAHGEQRGGVPRWVTALGGTQDLVASGSDDGIVKIWRVKERKLHWVRDISVGDGVIIGINVVAVDDEQRVNLIVGVSYEGRNGRWGGKVGKQCRVIVIE